MDREEKEKLHYGLVNFEKRKHPRFNVDLPVEYRRADLFVKQGDAANASEGGVLLYLPEQKEIGERLSLKLFFPSGSQLVSLEALVEVVWRDLPLDNDLGDYRTGVRFVDISLEDLGKLDDLLRTLSG